MSLPVDNKTLVKHEGCYDCGSVADPILTSVMTKRLFGKKQVPMLGSFALCAKCVQKENIRG